MTPRELLGSMFLELVDDPGDDRGEARLDELLAAHPDASAAAVAYLRARHVGGEAPVEVWETTEAFAELVRVLVVAGDEAAGQGVLAIAFDTPDVRQLRWLGELVMAAVEPDDLARALVAALHLPPTSRGHRNARELVYFTFDAADEDYAASDELAAALAAALDAPASVATTAR